MLDHKPVPDMHASLEIKRRKNQLIIGAVPDPVIPAAVGKGPAGRLLGARNGQEQAGIRMIRPEGKHFLRGQRIKTQRAAAHKPAEALSVTPEYGFLQAPADFRDRLRLNPEFFFRLPKSTLIKWILLRFKVGATIPLPRSRSFSINSLSTSSRNLNIHIIYTVTVLLYKE